VLVALLGAVAACDGTSTPLASAPPDAGAPADGVGAVVARAICAKIDECCTEETRKRIVGAGTDLASCESSFGAFYGRQYTLAPPTVAAGKARYDTAKLAECLDAFRGAGCSAPAFAASAVCGEVLTGVIEEGEACTTGFDCASRACRGDAGARTCKARKKDGELCEQDAECASRYCRSGFLGGRCTSETPRGEGCGGDAFWFVL
jgi:hypothetical protein